MHDDVGGFKKVSTQGEMAGTIFDNATHIISLLVQYFGTNDNLGYHLNEVTVSKLEKER